MPELSKSEKLWCNAYAVLKREEPDLVRGFEDALGFDTISTRSTKRLGEILRQKCLSKTPSDWSLPSWESLSRSVKLARKSLPLLRAPKTWSRLRQVMNRMLHWLGLQSL